MQPSDRNIVLIGFMGSGKTEVGRALASITGRRLVDTDDLIESLGRSISEIFASDGEVAFRAMERHAIAKAARRKAAIVATGGGAVLDAANVDALRRTGVLVYLHAEPAEIVRRLASSANRPLVDAVPGRRPARVRTLLRERREVYERVADISVASGGRSPSEIAREIVARIGVRTVHVDVPLRPYLVHVGDSLLDKASSLVAALAAAERVVVVSHPRIARAWGSKLGFETITFPQGEEHKTPETVARIHRALAHKRLHRDDILLALGGGVVGDVTGYAASTYMRGISYVQAPTTLLAMVDAAIGGKTGVNLPEGKNLVGTFHQPVAVIADIATLSTLPAREMRGGMAEVVKYAMIADPDLGRLIGTPQLEEIVVRSAAIKARVVAADEREAGKRAHLNYGHTLGHALEALGLAGRVRIGRARVPHHGEAIAVGMMFAAWLSVLSGGASEDLVGLQRELLERARLPVDVHGVTWRDVRPYVELDKKYARGVRWVLLREPGSPYVESDVPADALAEALRRVTEA